MPAAPSTPANDPNPLAVLALTGELAPTRLRLHSRTMMIALSHAIEEQAARSGPETVLIASFQRLSLLRSEAARYAALAPKLAQVYALGVADIAPPQIAGVTVIPIEADWPLTQEWCVIASGPRCAVALLSRDNDGFRLDRRSRRFAGLWTSDLAVVEQALANFYAAIGATPPAVRRDQTALRLASEAIRRAIG